MSNKIAVGAKVYLIRFDGFYVGSRNEKEYGYITSGKQGTFSYDLDGDLLNKGMEILNLRLSEVPESDKSRVMESLDRLGLVISDNLLRRTGNIVELSKPKVPKDNPANKDTKLKKSETFKKE